MGILGKEGAVLMPLIPTFERLKQDYQELEVKVSYLVSSRPACLKEGHHSDPALRQGSRAG